MGVDIRYRICYIILRKQNTRQCPGVAAPEHLRRRPYRPHNGITPHRGISIPSFVNLGKGESETVMLICPCHDSDTVLAKSLHSVFVFHNLFIMEGCA